jgi:hypothetical protein
VLGSDVCISFVFASLEEFCLLGYNAMQSAEKSKDVSEKHVAFFFEDEEETSLKQVASRII